MSFFSNLIKILYAGLTSFFSSLEGDITYEISILSSDISNLTYSWASYFHGYFGPVLLVVVIGVSFTAVYAVFDFSGVAKDVVGET